MWDLKETAWRDLWGKPRYILCLTSYKRSGIFFQITCYCTSKLIILLYKKRNLWYNLLEACRFLLCYSPIRVFLYRESLAQWSTPAGCMVFVHIMTGVTNYGRALNKLYFDIILLLRTFVDFFFHLKLRILTSDWML